MSTRQTLVELMVAYRQVLSQADRWFDDASSALGPMVGCHVGCCDCCRGLFDITLPDAILLQMGFNQLDSSWQQRVLQRCYQRRDLLQQQWPELQPPYLLNYLDNRSWQSMPEQDATPCPLLDDNGCCLVYAWRPLTCRLHGLPQVDQDGEVFSDGCCPYNEEAVSRATLGVERGPFRDLFTREAQLIRQVNQLLTARDLYELDTFIPLALLIDFSDSQHWAHPLQVRQL